MLNEKHDLFCLMKQRRLADHFRLITKREYSFVLDCKTALIFALHIMFHSFSERSGVRGKRGVGLG